ncbi:MAG TPA: hypothetical protein VIL42_05215 [Sphingomicrobium sp.]|jgi:hypothetical protein
MNATRDRMGWGARLLIAFVLILVGAAAAVWSLAHYQPAARFLGVAPPPAAAAQPPVQRMTSQQLVAPPPTQPDPRIADLEKRLAQVENAAQQAEGSAGRADALVVAFAARRAIDRGVSLGYLERLLRERFATTHQHAVATIITASHQPVRLEELTAQYEALGPELRRGGPQEGWWSNFRRELGQVVQIRAADRPAANPDARYRRAQQRLEQGDVDQALAETMRMPGASRAGEWIAKARRYIAAHRALDEIESAALLPTPNQNG